jgi:glycerol-3-phosphate dehydrogenase (NAD(P)+)
MSVPNQALQSPIAIFGAGAFGTALAIQLARRQPVRLWGRSTNNMATLQTSRLNKHYLPHVTLPNTVYCTAQLIEAVTGVEDAIIAIPSYGLPAFFKQAQPILDSMRYILIATKGLHADSSELLPTWLNTLGISYALLSGPSFAKEVAQGLPTAWVLASQNRHCTRLWQERLHQPGFQICLSQDTIGVSLCGAMKNIVAIAAGMVDGLELGENARSLIITQGLADMQRLGRALGAQVETFLGPAGIGDLSLTCVSNQSRNRCFGITIGQGLSSADAKKRLGLFPEGVVATRTICELATRQGVILPLCRMVYTVLFDRLPPQEAIFHLVNHMVSYVSK